MCDHSVVDVHSPPVLLCYSKPLLGSSCLECPWLCVDEVCLGEVRVTGVRVLTPDLPASACLR